jgi:hypothetical protein
VIQVSRIRSSSFAKPAQGPTGLTPNPRSVQEGPLPTPQQVKVSIL